MAALLLRPSPQAATIGAHVAGACAADTQVQQEELARVGRASKSSMAIVRMLLAPATLAAAAGVIEP